MAKIRLRLRKDRFWAHLRTYTHPLPPTSPLLRARPVSLKQYRRLNGGASIVSGNGTCLKVDHAVSDHAVATADMALCGIHMGRGEEPRADIGMVADWSPCKVPYTLEGGL